MARGNIGRMSPEATTLCLFLAFACFLLAAVNINFPRVNLTALGLALWVFTALAVAIKAL